jgi:hypothetical protein
MYFRKKPIIIEAIRYTGSVRSFNEIWDWMGGDEKDGGPNCGHKGPDDDPQEFDIQTPEGKMTASPGDWIIKGVKDEFYPCKPDIFNLTYEKVEDE